MQPQDYPIVGAALIAAMATIAGPAWQSEYESAWRAALAVVAESMLAGAQAQILEAAA